MIFAFSIKVGSQEIRYIARASGRRQSAMGKAWAKVLLAHPGAIFLAVVEYPAAK